MLEAVRGDLNQFKETLVDRFLDMEKATAAAASNDRSRLRGQRPVSVTERTMHVSHVGQPTGQSKVSSVNLPKHIVTVASPISEPRQSTVLMERAMALSAVNLSLVK